MSIAYKFSEAKKLGEGVYSTAFDGLYYLPHKVFDDERGFYSELSRIPEVEAITGNEFIIKQLNLAKSVTNVARGFHAERWHKLVTVTGGECFTALADIRPESATFGQVQTFLLGQKKEALAGCLFIPPGIANSLCVVEGPVYYLYAVDMLYADRDKSGDVAISLFDPDFGVEWPISKEKMIISERDQNAVSLRTKFPEMF